MEKKDCVQRFCQMFTPKLAFPLYDVFESIFSIKKGWWRNRRKFCLTINTHPLGGVGGEKWYLDICYFSCMLWAFLYCWKVNNFQAPSFEMKRTNEKRTLRSRILLNVYTKICLCFVWWLLIKEQNNLLFKRWK